VRTTTELTTAGVLAKGFGSWKSFPPNSCVRSVRRIRSGLGGDYRNLVTRNTWGLVDPGSEAGPVASRRRAGPRLHSRLSRHSTAFTRTCVSRLQQALALTQGVATVRMRVV